MNGPAQAHTAGHAHLALPADRFYWGVLHAEALPRRARSPKEQLGYLFESVLPVSVDTIQAAYVPVGPDRVIACGMPLADLHALTAHPWLALSPEALPDFVRSALTQPVEPSRFNLLTGEFEPLDARRHRRRVTWVACATMLLCAALFAAAHSRRATLARQYADALESATTQVYSRVLPDAGGALPPAARLTAELRALDRTRAVPSSESLPAEITPPLAAVLASWPDQLHLTTEALSASASAITLSVRLPDEATAQRFESELRAPPGWVLSQPNLVREREGIVMRVRMNP
ncbi:MAG: hypothetical protein ACF8LK_03795, partial [Phycisphaerales bacterium JB041]